MNSEMKEQIRGLAKKLIGAVDSGSLHEAVEIITSLNNARHEYFFQEVVELTQALQDSIREMSEDASIQLSATADAVSVEASDCLEHVIKMTEKSTMSTFDFVDALKEKVKFLEIGGADPEMIEKINSDLEDIILNQSVQDLSSQLIQKVIRTITEVESRLTALIQISSNVEKICSMNVKMSLGVDSKKQEEKSAIKAEGPQYTEEGLKKVCDQDAVDDLLAELGI